VPKLAHFGGGCSVLFGFELALKFERFAVVLQCLLGNSKFSFKAITVTLSRSVVHHFHGKELDPMFEFLKVYSDGLIHIA
jgi:hypothetical protein